MTYGICWDRGAEMEALALATYLRRDLQQTCEYALQGKTTSQFERLKRNGCTFIVIVRRDLQCRFWRWCGPNVNCSLEDFKAYAAWLADDSDVLPDPPAYKFEQDAA